MSQGVDTGGLPDSQASLDGQDMSFAVAQGPEAAAIRQALVASGPPPPDDSLLVIGNEPTNKVTLHPSPSQVCSGAFPAASLRWDAQSTPIKHFCMFQPVS